MSASDHYFRIPMLMLRYGSSALEALEAMADVGTINAGIARSKTLSDEEDDDLYEESCQKSGLPDEAENWIEKCAVIGSRLVGMNWGGWRNIRRAAETYDEMKELGGYSSFFTISSRTLWAAINTARADERGTPFPEHAIDYREFRVLAAIASAKPNRFNFTFLGWESIQHRACGYVHKDDLKNCVELPDHALRLTRDQIERTVKRLESLRFFLRVRHATGQRGGWMAYSLRHSEREHLVRDIVLWQEFNQGRVIDQNRADDARLALQIKETRKSPASNQQAPLQVYPQPSPQAPPQHNDKCSEEKSDEEKSSDEKCADDLLRSRAGYEDSVSENGHDIDLPSLVTEHVLATKQQPYSEQGYVLEGRFLTQSEMHELGIQAATKDPSMLVEIAKNRKPAVRSPDGTIEIIPSQV